MDDRTVGTAQAKLMRAALLFEGVTISDLWWAYFLDGGEVQELEIDAFLHQSLHLPSSCRDHLARTVNVLIPEARIPYSRYFGPVNDAAEN